MDSNQRTSIILAAIASAGPVGDNMADWMGRVENMTAQITVLTGDRSPLVKTVEGIERSKVFPGSVISVRREQSTTRGVVTIFTGTDRTNTDALNKSVTLPAGCEQFRTERTDDPAGMVMANRMGSLVGHRCMFWVEVEASAGNADRKVRVVRNVQDLGLSTDQIAKEALASREAARAQRVAS